MILHIVANQGEIIFGSDDYDKVSSFVSKCEQRDLDEALDENGLDRDNPNHVLRAQFEAGYDNGTYDIYTINTDDFNEQDEMTVGDVEITLFDVERTFAGKV
jgi:hypothetical protein